LVENISWFKINPYDSDSEVENVQGEIEEIDKK